MSVQSIIERQLTRAVRWSELVLWELRIQGWGRHGRSRTYWVLFITAILLCLIWALTLLILRYGRIDSSIEASICVIAMQTPFGEGAFSFARAGFAYTFLKLCALVAASAARLFIPGISGSGVAADRRTGRLAELRTTLYSSGEIVTAKTVAAAAAYVGACGVVFAAMIPVLILTRASAWEVVFDYVEMAGSILLIASVTVTCSVMVSYGNYRRAVAYLVCWLPLPIFWAAAITFAGHLPENQMLGVLVGHIPVHDWYIESLTEFQIGVTALLILSAYAISVWRLFPRDRIRNGEAK